MNDLLVVMETIAKDLRELVNALKSTAIPQPLTQPQPTQAPAPAENFAKIASIVRGAGGEYISAGKESHFRIPKRPH